jgi:hypothetical protein
VVNKETHIVENDVIVKGLADILKFDEVIRRYRHSELWDSHAHARPLLLMSLRVEANQIHRLFLVAQPHLAVRGLRQLLKWCRARRLTKSQCQEWLCYWKSRYRFVNLLKISN